MFTEVVVQNEKSCLLGITCKHPSMKQHHCNSKFFLNDLKKAINVVFGR